MNHQDLASDGFLVNGIKSKQTVDVLEFQRDAHLKLKTIEASHIGQTI